MTIPTCSYAGCRRPVYRCVPWAGGLAFCRLHLAVFHGQPAPVPGDPGEAPSPPIRGRVRSNGAALTPPPDPPEAPARQGQLALTDPPRRVN
jgi:hypothetical protein